MNTKALNIDREIVQINNTICKNIEIIDSSERGFLSQNILAQLRNLVEHVMLKVWKAPDDVQNNYDNICRAIEYTKSRGNLKFLRRFHDYLQIVASHYTLDETNSERLMLKYYEFLLKLKSFLGNTYGLDVLQNIEKFPVNTDPGLKQYHDEIAKVLDRHQANLTISNRKDRYYIHKVKPFFVNQNIYYEVTFTSTNANASKFDRVIAFTSIDISSFYAAKFALTEERIVIMGRTMSVFVITDWEVSIRPCEIDNYSRIFGVHSKTTGGNATYRKLMQYLTETGLHLVEVIDLADQDYHQLKKEIVENGTKLTFFSVLDQCRCLSQRSKRGTNVIRYLLLRLNNKIIKRQLERTAPNSILSGLYLKNGCIPFDDMPYNSSLIYHNPRLSDLFECIRAEDRKHELLARFIRNNTEIRGHIYSPIEEVNAFGDVKLLSNTYNKALWSGHTGRIVKEFHNHLFISEYQENTLIALRHLKTLASSGIQNYSSSVEYWLDSNVHYVDCDEKKTALKKMFTRSQVALIYGPAGTGKSTIINHIAHLYANNSKTFLANTNPAIDNLKRKVDAPNCSFSTIAKYLGYKNNSYDCDLLIIDECSTVSNKDIKDVLSKARLKLLVLVGDIYQIESIRFGNWFSAARSFIPQTSVVELTTPYRSHNDGLLELWKRVRNSEDTIVECIAKNGYSCNLDVSIFEHTGDEEIILCLNYDGLYGINNINRFLQESNPNPAVSWGVQSYKVNDPILFNESNRFAPLIYNNMKGKIHSIEVLEEVNQIQYDIEIDKTISGIDADAYDFDLLENAKNGNSVIRFTVNRYKTTDEDDDESGSDIVPFQVAYAASIHKAQGLEYESVKIVITDETDELITHNIFYTAITRARNMLKIYWSPEVEKRVLERFNSTKKNQNKDVALLKLCDPELASI